MRLIHFTSLLLPLGVLGCSGEAVKDDDSRDTDRGSDSADTADTGDSADTSDSADTGVATETECADGTDNDADGAADCDDTDCEGSDACAQVTCWDEDLADATGASVAVGSTVGAGDDVLPSCDPTDATSEDRTFRWTAPAAGDYRISTAGSGFATTVTLWSGDCSGTELVCAEDILERGFAAGEDVVIAVDGFGGASGDYVLNILPAGTTESDCANGDDDLDTLADCDDPDCAADARCIPEANCGDSLDEDLDGATDCDDTDCAAAPVCIPEANCGDALDEDLDGATDCADTDCAADPRCLPETACTDGLDDDLDGAIDCDDADCAAEASCVPEVDCADGLDSDLDGFTDCDDTDCTSTAACLASCLSVTDLGSAMGTSVASGTTSGGGNDLSGSCGGSSAEDLAFTWTAPAADTYTFSTDGSAYDTILVVGEGTCAGLTELDCDDDSGESTQSLLTATLAAGDVVVIDVDGYASNAGSFELNIYASTENDCADGLDNDGNGAADCDDTACDLSCPEDRCDDGGDDDGDGLTDCDDTDCAASAICTEETSCTDGLDDDGDGYTDCDDASCADDAYCIANACYDDSLGSAVGADVVVASLSGDDVATDCGYGGDDAMYSWTAPASGTWTFTGVADYTYDYAVVDVSTGDCSSMTSLACDNAYSAYDGSPSVSVTLTAGDTVSIGLESYYGYVSSIALSIYADSEYDCFDGIDNDDDGTADCDDAACAASCFELDCRDGLDGEGDGFADCDDSECAADVTCIPETACTDGLDSDLDGMTDCDDSDCASDFTCGATCYDSTVAGTLGYGVATGTNVGAGDDRTPSCADYSGGEDVAIVWTAPFADTFTFNTDDSTYDTVMTVEDPSCVSNEQACDDDSGWSVASQASVTLAAGEQVVVNIDGYDSYELGTYVLNVYSTAEQACDDGTDEDGDGSTDCDDADCAADAACLETACADGTDDDADGSIDCLDSDCSASSSCSSALADYVLGSVTSGSSSGTPVASGTTSGATSSFTASCASSSRSADLAYVWVAPTTATYTFDLGGSSYDTALSLRSMTGTEYACNDDYSGTTSLLTRSMRAGEAVLVVVDGYSTYSSGAFQLRIY